MSELFLGKKCSHCGFEWNTEEDIKEREPTVRGNKILCSNCLEEEKSKPKTETVKERAIYVYLPSIEKAEEWKNLAKEAKVSVSKFVIDHVENSVSQEEDHTPRSELLKRLENLKEENNDLRERNKRLEALAEKLEKELKDYRMKPFLEETEGYREYEKDLVDLLKRREEIRSDEILDALSVEAFDTKSVKAIQKQLENLESYGLVKATVRGWKWKG